MFSAVWQKIKEMMAKMIGSKTIARELQITPMVSSQMQESIQLWSDLYQGNAPWLHEPTYLDPTRVTSIGLPAFIASEKARMAVLEFKSQVTTPIDETDGSADGDIKNSREDKLKDVSTKEKRAKFLDIEYKKLKDNLRTQLEYGIAKGGLVIKPYVVFNKKPSFDDTNEEIESYSIEFDFVQADNFYPLAYDSNGKITEAAFIQTKVEKDAVYRRLEYHKWESGVVTIMNTAYKSSNDSISGSTDLTTTLGEEVALANIPEWRNMQPITTINNVKRPLFAYFKMPLANTINTGSPLGVSAYSRAIDLIKDADIQYSTLLWEYEGGQMAVDIDRDALRFETDSKGNHHSVMSQLQQRLYRNIDLGADGNTYEPFAPALRDNNYINGLNTILMQIENVTGLSRGTLSEVTTEARTATELKILKQRSYSANAEIQKALEVALRDVVYIMDVYCTLYNITPDGDYEVSFEWDDSILVDVDAELEKRVILLQNGLTSKLETRMWYFGETEKQAKEALNRIEQENRDTMEKELMKFVDDVESQENFNEGKQGQDNNDFDKGHTIRQSKDNMTNNMNPPQPKKPKDVK